MAQQLRESPPETAGNLLPGKWEADLGQGGDMNGESHNKACRHRSRTSPSEKDTLRLDMSPGANSGGRSFLHELCLYVWTPSSHVLLPRTLHFFSVLLIDAKSGHFSIISQLTGVVFAVQPRG